MAIFTEYLNTILGARNGEKRPLITDEPAEFEE